MNIIRAELTFLKSLIAVNLSSAMEYRISFISQAVGMLINNAVYFLFWIIFFNQFGTVRGYVADDIFVLFAVVALGFGLGTMFTGNTGADLAYLIAQGRLDYYLVFPRNLLIHIIFSRMKVPAIGDITFGIIAFLFTGLFQPLQIVLFVVAGILTALNVIAFMTLTGSLAFYMGNAQYTSQQMNNAFLTLAMYPNTLFTGVARFLLFTILPSAFIGFIPAEMVAGEDGQLLLVLIGVTVLMWGLATAVFYNGIRRYESGSAININV